MRIGILKLIISSKSDFSLKTDGLAKLSAPVSEYCTHFSLWRILTCRRTLQVRARDRGVSAPSILANVLPWLPVMPWLEARVHPATQENRARLVWRHDSNSCSSVQARWIIAPFWSYCRLNDLFLRYSTSQNPYFTNSPSGRRERRSVKKIKQDHARDFGIGWIMNMNNLEMY